MTQTSLFDPAQVSPRPCPVPGCGAIRTAGQTGFIPTCAHDQDRDNHHRPRKCLNHWNERPEDDIPY